MTKNYIPWLRWWLFFVLLSFGTLLLSLTGVIQKINQSDITRISYLIYAVFLYFSLRTGVDTYFLCKRGPSEDITMREQTGWFVSNTLLTLGMIGTVVGFIYMLTSFFIGVAPDDISSMRILLSKMSMGMGTALYTTAAGLVCSLLLKLQLYNLSYHVQQTK